MKSIPPWLRPREKLRLLGADALSERELLAVLIGSATRRRSVWQVAEDLLEGGESLRRLTELGLDELAALPGLGEAGAARLLAAVEVGRRVARHVSCPEPVLDCAAAVDERLRPRLLAERRECVMALLLDARHRLRAERCISIGTLTSSVIHPREVFRPAISVAAAALILVHNHPSGDPSPSVEDHQVTARLREVGALLGIPLLDHVIVAAEGYRSFREEGWLAD